jgi:endonuclease-3 related protein
MGMNPQTLYDALLAAYGDPHWWPADSPYEVMVGAVLTQNTAWGNVEKAIANLQDALTPSALMALSSDELIDRIRPAGFFNQKAVYLRALTDWYARYDYDVATVQRMPLHTLRAELLAVKGIGRETADSILLYAFGLPTFVVDAYTIRLCQRLGLPVGEGYEAVKAYFEAALPRDAAVFNRFHALIVVHGKARCHKKSVCAGCPIAEHCTLGEGVAP